MNGACELESTALQKCQWYRLCAIKSNLQLKQNAFFWDSGEGICVTEMFATTAIFYFGGDKLLPKAHYVSR